MEPADLSPHDERRRRARYRAWHRGTREMDLLLGRFADAELETFGADELAAFEVLLEAPDPELFAWLLGHEPVPPAHDTPVFRRLIEFYQLGRGGAPR